MNETQRKIFHYGAVLAVLCGLFPPWVAVQRHPETGVVGASEAIGYSLILSPPDLTDPPVSDPNERMLLRLFGKGYKASPATSTGRRYSWPLIVEIDLRRLVVQFFVIAVGFGAAFVLKRTS